LNPPETRIIYGVMSKENIIERLNALLADAHILNVKLHNYHWNVQGPQFLPVHELTEGYYNHFFGLFDDIAERILQLGSKPLATTKADLEATGLSEETGNAFGPKEIFESIQKDFEYLHEKAVSLLKLAEDENDVTTGNMMADLNDWLEKAIWMLRQSQN